jgi:hypothetical protein
MKIVLFFHREEVYKNTREGPCPILLGFGKKYKIVVFKYLDPDH